MRKLAFIIIFIIIIIGGFYAGIYFYNTKNLNNKESDKTIVGVEIDDECTDEAELEEIAMQKTNSGEEKVTPNTTLTIKKFYKQCNHLIQSTEKVVEEVANLNEEEFKQKYSDWEIQKFASNEIVLYKEIDDFCHEHYSLKVLNGFIAIYELDKNDVEIKLLTVTDISVEYLTETDVMALQNGMKIYTKQELNKILEDFE